MIRLILYCESVLMLSVLDLPLWLKVETVVDDDTFPRSRVSVTPLRVQDHGYYSIIGCSHGLFCLFLIGREFLINGLGKAAFCNPTIRKTVELVVASVANGETYATVLGFGVCRETNDTKIVKITHIVSWGDMETASCIHWQVGVFTLSAWAWRRLGGNPPRKLVSFQFDLPDGFCSVSIDGVIYWLATMDGGSCNLIISYDITSEVFGEVNLPNRLAHSPPRHWLSLFKLKESLVVLDNVCEQDRIAYDVWRMVFLNHLQRFPLLVITQKIV
uniref:Putative F-box associated interaction domain-containing protein n=1 Tax=Helianthus annuus TaxID=4232 RepID=A0A251UCU8_HELAN